MITKRPSLRRVSWGATQQAWSGFQPEREISLGGDQVLPLSREKAVIIITTLALCSSDFRKVTTKRSLNAAIPAECMYQFGFSATVTPTEAGSSRDSPG